MKKNTVLILFLFSFYLNIQSQSKTGEIHYGEVQSLGIGGLAGYDYRALLVFNAESSLYTTRKDSLEKKPIRGKKIDATNTTTGGTIFSASTSPVGLLYILDRKKDSVFSKDFAFLYLAEDIPLIQWKIIDETKEIGTFTAQKATAAFRGRDYTAWFTSEIPLPYGPWKLQGLPGMILEAYDKNKEIYWYFKAINYPCDDCEKFLKPIQKPADEEWINFEEYKSKLISFHKNTLTRSKIFIENMANKELKTHVTVPEFNMSSTYIEVFEDPNKNKK